MSPAKEIKKNLEMNKLFIESKEIEIKKINNLPENSDEWPEPITSENSKTVLRRRYLKKDEDGKPIETAKDLFLRVASAVAVADKKFDKDSDIENLTKRFYQMMANFEFMPNSPTLMNAGRTLGQLSACFVLPVGDSMSEIFDAVKQTALIHKSGGGTGFSFSRLRPSGDRVRSTSGVSSGPISFMKAFDAATETVKQGGTRRGANMGILRVDHPDILDFIDAKTTEGVLANFNISVAITDKFIEALEKNEEFELLNPRDKKVVRKISAKETFDKIVENAWKNGEPGIIFIDRINKYNPTPKIGDIESTNPCGEQPLLPYESCNLGSINLSRMTKNDSGGKISVDWGKLAKITNDSVHFLDNVIEINNYPLPEIDKMTRSNRKIGLGIMGFADLLIKLKIPYNSEKAISIAKKIMKFIDEESKEASKLLAKEKGAFPNYEKSIFAERGEDPLRNATTTTIAPTGTISIIANASSGIEPLFAVCYQRKVMDDDILIEVHPEFEKIAKGNGFYSEGLMKEIAESGDIKNFSEIPDEVKEIFITAHDVTPTQHIELQAAFQEYTDNAVSKTINFPNSATKEDIKNAYLLAYKHGCKGVTVYRDGSRDQQVLSTGKTETAKNGDKKTETVYETKIKPRPRPELVFGTTEKIPTGIGDMYITINEDCEGMNEVFVHLGKSGGEATAMNEAIGRLISLALRSRVEPKIIAKHLRGIRGSSPVWQNGQLILSCPDAIGKAISRYIERSEKLNLEFPEERVIPHDSETKKNISTDQAELLSNLCPDCGGEIKFESGCYTCHGCGYSKCG
ncbi:MAG: ribonucleoside-diphosphate reductase NrdZ [Candidatus Berkelbacteria bacterium Athens1014_28]|uniref:Vitamin B12-dependent ribonucleotide reductase n=1 Tax=Candidatus Berkelbacteria bacterium Athens1014_28 TaxID=2017145 RepID=A0A554LNT0_9BACT|nr:MAG: ribonucleoside-diphosphate reductase NrdZ [Candidatus Berkelbacteria bacterium Athens1014_28]